MHGCPFNQEKTNDMKIKNIWKVCRANRDSLSETPCVRTVTDSPDGLSVLLDPMYTRGRTVARSGDYIVQYASGLYQRFGSEAFARLERNPQ